MLSLTPDSTASLSFSELRALVVDLIGEVRALRAENEELRTTHIALKVEVQSLTRTGKPGRTVSVGWTPS
jgi:hypothetical protein